MGESKPIDNNYHESSWGHPRTLKRQTQETTHPKNTIKNLMKSTHQNTIKYLTYIISNKREIDHKQAPVAPPP